jgi:hypothetical protein
VCDEETDDQDRDGPNGADDFEDELLLRSEARAGHLNAESAAPAGLSFQADDGARTRDPQLGKLMLYQLSYVRVPNRIAALTRIHARD